MVGNPNSVAKAQKVLKNLQATTSALMDKTRQAAADALSVDEDVSRTKLKLKIALQQLSKAEFSGSNGKMEARAAKKQVEQTREKSEQTAADATDAQEQYEAKLKKQRLVDAEATRLAKLQRNTQRAASDARAASRSADRNLAQITAEKTTIDQDVLKAQNVASAAEQKAFQVEKAAAEGIAGAKAAALERKQAEEAAATASTKAEKASDALTKYSDKVSKLTSPDAHTHRDHLDKENEAAQSTDASQHISVEDTSQELESKATKATDAESAVEQEASSAEMDLQKLESCPPGVLSC
jgi:hypothetical protein